MAKATAVTDVADLFRRVYLIRQVEQSLTRLFSDGEVPGFIHLSIGQEAVAAGVCSALTEHDTLATTHRGHGHVLARGIDLSKFYREIMGKQGGICGGRGGSMHVADMGLGILGANGIVGAGIPIAVGSALGHQVRGNHGVAVVFFGDGAMAEGVLHESLNIAALWQLPVLFVCENNGWSEFSPTSRQFVAALKDLAAAFKLPHAQVDGNDAIAVAAAAGKVVRLIRSGKGPSVLECSTRRVRGHYEGDPQKYRPEAELASFDEDDPLTRVQSAWLASGASQADIEKAKHQIDQAIEAAITQARADQPPVFESALAGVYASAAS